MKEISCDLVRPRGRRQVTKLDLANWMLMDEIPGRQQSRLSWIKEGDYKSIFL